MPLKTESRTEELTAIGHGADIGVFVPLVFRALDHLA